MKHAIFQYWDDKLAIGAEKWARQCTYGNNEEAKLYRHIPSYYYPVGQNAGFDGRGWKTIFWAWDREKEFYKLVSLIQGSCFSYGVWPYKTKSYKFPGPSPYPFFGTLTQLLSKGVDEFDSEVIKKYGKVSLTWACRQPQLLVADPDMVREINIKQFPNFVNRVVTRGRFAMTDIERNQLTMLEDDHWKFVRATLTPAFSSGRTPRGKTLLHHWKCVRDHFDSFLQLGRFKRWFHYFKNCTANLMDIIAERSKRGESFGLVFPFVARILQYFNISSMPKESQQTIDVIKRDVKSNIEQRKQQEAKRRDLLQLMIDARADDIDKSEDKVDAKYLENNIKHQRKGLTEAEIMAQSFIFLVAGYATTAGTMSLLAYNLALHPECQGQVIEEIDSEIGEEKPTYDNVTNLHYLDMCLSETLRLFPATSRTTREAKDDIVIKGHLIPKDMAVQFPVGYLHRNPEHWPEPEKFKPERFTPEEKAKRHPYVYMPFGVGPRNCVGMRLAQLEAKMAIVTILQKFRFVRSVDTEVPIKFTKIGLNDPVNGIWLKIESRSGHE
ncbi:cytochrome P450 3A29-like [Liolophura sinensis]|uniref:cytochrome P450 3A29-like n=1 Tax=Liolophura sinensis TaxID=3198878 RepID=UPI003158C385